MICHSTKVYTASSRTTFTDRHTNSAGLILLFAYLGRSARCPKQGRLLTFMIGNLVWASLRPMLLICTRRQYTQLYVRHHLMAVSYVPYGIYEVWIDYCRFFAQPSSPSPPSASPLKIKKEDGAGGGGAFQPIVLQHDDTPSPKVPMSAFDLFKGYINLFFSYLCLFLKVIRRMPFTDNFDWFYRIELS